MSEPTPRHAASIDVLVVGGGITGCAVARDAAARGLSVTLVEKTDLAAGTSSRSTKLLHGGLRYLEHGHLALVREALREREITARLAPALARPLRFVIPLRRGMSPGRVLTRVGVAMYGALAGRNPLPRGRGLSRAELARLAPVIGPGWTDGVAFSDRQTDDARLTIAIARDAVRRGAIVRLGVEVVAIERRAEGRFSVMCRGDDGHTYRWDAASVVNATGPWVDRVRGLDGRPGPLLQPSRGAHLVLSGVNLEDALLLYGRAPGHRLFAIPWRGVVLFGTSDVADAGDPGRGAPEVEDLRMLFDEARRLFPAAGLSRSHVVSAFTGIRPLLRQRADTLHASREHRVVEEDGLVTIAGGKLTTWRTMAIATVDAVVRRLGRGGPSPRSLLQGVLPGGAIPSADVETSVRDEMARTAEDVLFRRLPIGHDPSQVRAALPEVVSRLADAFGWDAPRRAAESDTVLSRLQRAEAHLDAALRAH